jgi:hypothetical protein
MSKSTTISDQETRNLGHSSVEPPAFLEYQTACVSQVRYSYEYMRSQRDGNDFQDSASYTLEAIVFFASFPGVKLLTLLQGPLKSLENC